MKQENEKYCHECAAIINTTAEICSSCGVRQVISEEIITSSFSQKLDHNKEQDLKDKEVEKILFQQYLIIDKNKKANNTMITSFFR